MSLDHTTQADENTDDPALTEFLAALKDNLFEGDLSEQKRLAIVNAIPEEVCFWIEDEEGNMPATSIIIEHPEYEDPEKRYEPVDIPPMSVEMALIGLSAKVRRQLLGIAFDEAIDEAKDMRRCMRTLQRDAETYNPELESEITAHTAKIKRLKLFKRKRLSEEVDSM